MLLRHARARCALLDPPFPGLQPICRRSVGAVSRKRTQDPSTTRMAPPPVRLEHPQAISRARREPGAPTSVPVYPERLNIYDSGLPPQVIMGAVRVAGIAVFALGTTVYAPSCYLDPATPWWIAPVAVVASFLPLATSVLAFGPYVHHIYVDLPAGARNSREALLRFTQKPPPSTRLRVSSQRLIPWPVTRSVALKDLWRLPVSRMRLANLEWRPPAVRQKATGAAAWLIRQYYGRFYVSRGQIKDRSLAPGVFDQMWERIPMLGSGGKPQRR